MNIFAPAENERSRIKLSRKAIEAALAAHPRGHRGRYWFEDQPGLHLLVSKGGCASYCLRYQKLSGLKGDFTIGRADRITLQEAKEKARDCLAALTLRHQDPVAARREARMEAQAALNSTFRGLCDEFLGAAEIKALSIRTTTEWKRILEKHVLPELGASEAVAIARRDVKSCLRSIQRRVSQRVAASGPEELDPKAGNRTANAAQGVIRRVYNWAIDEDRLENNPATFKKMFDERPLKRVGALNECRIRAIWSGIEKELLEGWGIESLIAIKLAFVTLQRPNEICNARLEQFDWERRVWLIPEGYTKTNACYEIPLSEIACTLFQRAFDLSDNRWAFLAKDGRSQLRPNVLSHRFAKLRKRLVKSAALPTLDIELYDARRFGRTYIEHTLGFPDHVAEAVINHAGDQTMKRRYDVGDHTQIIRRAHEAWVSALLAITSSQEPLAGNVLKFTAR
jgi:integrase